MQKFLLFEITTATKDRPRFFQAITLFLFAFSLAMILIGSLARVSTTQTNSQVSKSDSVNYPFAGFISSPSQPLLQLEK